MNQNRNGLLAVAGALMMSIPGFAATNSCPPLQTSGNVGYPVAGPDDTVYGGGAFTGCQVVNAVFSNWTTLNTGGTYIGSAVTAGQSNDPLVTSPTFRLATERGNFSDVPTGTGGACCANNDGDNNYSTASIDGLVGGTVSFVATTSTYAIDEISFVFTNVVHGTSGSVGITPIFCLGGNVTGNFTASTCASGGGTAVSPGFTNIVGNGTQTANFSFAESLRVAVTFSVNLTAGTAGTAGFNYMDLDFAEVAPEPSSFILLGSALACLGAWVAMTRRKNVSSLARLFLSGAVDR